MALKVDGSLWTWGGNSVWQLGTGDTNNRTAPTRIGSGNDWRSISAVSIHTLALKANGSLWAWGDNVCRQLGLWNAIHRSNPTLAFNGVRVPSFYSAFTGSDRYETAILISRRAYPTGAPAVCLVKGDNFPDALAAAPLATAYGGPVVITPSGGLTAAVTAELQRLSPRERTTPTLSWWPPAWSRTQVPRTLQPVVKGIVR